MDDKANKNLSREAATWRLKFRGAEREVEDLQKRIQELEAQVKAPPDMETLQARIKELEAAQGTPPDDFPDDDDIDDAHLVALRDEILAKVIDQQLTAAGALYPAEVRELLTSRGHLVVGGDDLPALVVNGEPQPIETKHLERLMPPAFMKAQGATGSGSHGGSRHPAGGSVFPIDQHRFLNDRAYREQVKVEMQARANAGGQQ